MPLIINTIKGIIMSHSYKGISNTPNRRQRILDPWCFWADAFSSEEVDEICRLMSQTPVETGMIAGDAIHPEATIKTGTVDNQVRRSKIAFHNPNPDTLWIFERLNAVIDQLNVNYFNFDINGYNAFQYSEYDAADNGKYDWHMDLYLGNMPEHDYETRKLSLVLLLSEPGVDFTGGEFEMKFSSVDKTETISLSKGKIILFPSFLFHRVAPVLTGIRKSIVVWVLGPKFR
jgi:PKHD-type hydroxylase